MFALVVHDGRYEPRVILLNDSEEIEPWLLAHPQFDGLLVSSIVVDDRLAGLPDEFPWESLDTGPLRSADETFSRSELHQNLNDDRNPVPEWTL